MRVILFSFFILVSVHLVQGKDSSVTTIKVGGFSNQAPYVFDDGSGKLVGLAVDLLDAVMHEMGRTYELSIYEPSNYSPASVLEECTIFLSQPYDPNLALNYYFSNSYDVIGYDVLSNGEEVYRNPRQLIDKVVILLKEGLSESKMELFGVTNVKDLIYVENLNDGLNLLSKGIGDYMICSSNLSNSMVNQKDLLSIKSYDSGFSKTRICFMLNEVELTMKINKAMEVLVKNGTYQHIYNKWFNIPKPLISGLELAIVALSFLVILLFLVLFIFILKGRVKGNLLELQEKNSYISNLINSIHLLNKRGDVTILMFDVLEHKLSVLRKSDFVSTNISLEKLEDKIHPEDRDYYYSELQKLLNGTLQELSIEFRLYSNSQNQYNDYTCIMSPVKVNSKGRVVRYILSLRNETDLKELIREREEAMKSLSLALGVAKIIRWKYYWEEATFSITDKELNERRFTFQQVSALISEKDRHKLNLMPRLASNELDEFNATMWHRTPDSDLYKPYEVHVSAIRDKEGKLLFIHGISYDISEIYNYQEQLNEKIELLETIEESLPVGMMVYDKEGNLQSVNEAQVALLGVDREKMLGEKFNLFNHKSIGEGALRAIQSGLTVDVELTHSAISQELYPFMDAKASHAVSLDMKCTPIKSSMGELKGYISIYIDTTQMHRDKEEISLLKDRMLLALHAGELTVLRYKPNEQMVHIINGDTSLVGESLSLHEVLELTHPDDCNSIQQYLNSITTRKEKKVNFDIRMKPAANVRHYRWYRLSFTAELRNESISSLIGTVKDVTKEVEGKISLERAKEKAVVSERLKMAFLANMSHEIRTPLNAIVGFSELLQTADTDDEREEYVGIISKNNELLLRLIGDILDLSKIESGSMKVRQSKFDLVEKFNEIYQTVSTQLPTSQIQFTSECLMSECMVLLDEERVAQVMNNFVSNAVKYTKKGTITMSLIREDEGVKFSVTDTGVGIEEENHPYVFQRFQKFDSFVQGTGLGLAICKAIADLLKGEIGFTSRKGEGSVFWIWFPLTLDHTE
ncbi:MAG: ATP-binding protein [Phocaeicola sp.]